LSRIPGRGPPAEQRSGDVLVNTVTQGWVHVITLRSESENGQLPVVSCSEIPTVRLRLPSPARDRRTILGCSDSDVDPRQMLRCPRVVRTNDEGSAGARVCLLSAAIFRSLARAAGQFSSDIQLQLASSSDDEPSSMANFFFLVIYTYLTGRALSSHHTWHQIIQIQIKGYCNVGDLDEIRHYDRSMHHITHWHHTSSAIKSASLLPKSQL
jgi:hypothetical protein